MSSVPSSLSCAFVTPWYGPDIPGGAEAEARRTAQNLAGAGVAVRVLTTCLAGLGSDWDTDYYPPGETVEQGVIVTRFPTGERDGERFASLNARVMAGEILSPSEERAFLENMVPCPALLDHIAAHPEQGPFFFIPYLFTSSILGPLIHPQKSVLIPCLHDEGYARLPAVRRAFESARAIAFHVDSERELAASLYELRRTEPLVLGEGVDTEWEGDGERFKGKYGVQGPFILYAGRKDAGKNVPLLAQYFLRYLQERSGLGGLKLCMIGNLPAPIPPGGEEVIIDLGFMETQDKYDAYHAARLLVQPSLMESFSLVIMESWLAGRPVMVHGGCPVTRDHVQKSGGGLYFADYPHFAESLDLVLGDEGLSSRMGAAGRAYVLQNYSWPVVTRRFVDLIRRLSSEPVLQPRKSVGAVPARSRDKKRPPAVHQMLADFSYGDAIGNEVLAIQKALRSWGLESDIFAQNVHQRLRGRIRAVEEFAPGAAPDDVLIFHFSHGKPLADDFPGMPGRKVLRYHNITPARFLRQVMPQAAANSQMGREQLARLAPAVELGLGASPFNTAELVAAGCEAAEVLPIVLDLDRLNRAPDPLVMSRFASGPANILHVGRIVPQKCIQDLIKVHYWLGRLIPGSRLLIVGGGLYDTAYGRGLRCFAAELGAHGVHFSGHVSDQALLAYYQRASLYLTLSEHEGFCVPLVESMNFGLPLVAYDSTGVTGTLGDGGILLKEKDPLFTAELIRLVLTDSALRRSLAAASRARLERFQPQRVLGKLKRLLSGRLGLEDLS